MKKTVLKFRMWTKNFGRLQNFFSHLNFSLFRKQRYEKKYHPLFGPLFIVFSNKINPNFFTCFICCFKIHSNKIDFKKDFSKDSSSSRKNDSAPIQLKFFEL